jgi:peptidoglycan/xylan/chitin deacetylase (PgdA/CDA1 family)
VSWLKQWCLPASLAAVALALVATGTSVRANAAESQTASPARAASHGRVAATAQSARTVVTFTWGGGLADQTAALPIFQRYGMHATFYVPSGFVCEPSADPGCTHLPYLTLSDIHQIARDGNEIGGLSVGHAQLTGIPAAEAQRQICDDRLNLTRWGFQVTDFAYPFAKVTEPLEVLVQRCGYNSALGTGQLRGAGLCADCPYAETIPPRDPYLLRAPIEVASVGTVWSPATFEKIVTGAQNHGGGWIIFTIHDVCAQACSLGVTPAELTTILGWLSRQASQGVSVRTVREVIGGQVRPVVAGPRPARIPPPGVTNSRLSEVTANGIPACFETAHYGTNDATFQYRPGAGPGGAGAELISVAQHKSGTAQLLPTLDLGECAPMVSAGRTYTVGAWYKSSGPVAFNVYYRTAVGTWKFWATGPQLAAAPGWTAATWAPPAVPAGATAISFGLALRADGTVTTTRYSLAPVHYTTSRLIASSVVVAAVIVAAVVTRRFRRRTRSD